MARSQIRWLSRRRCATPAPRNSTWRCCTPPAQRAKRLDGRLAASLIGLPEQVTGAVDEAAYRSPAVRDLLRGDTTGLPSGEEVAGVLGETPLTADQASYLSPEPDWAPPLPAAGPRFGLTDLLIG